MRVALELEGDRLFAADVSSTMVESVGPCATPVIPSNRHVFALAQPVDLTMSIDGGVYVIPMTGVGTRVPMTGLVLQLERKAGFLDATLTWRREDAVEAPLRWTLSTQLRLDEK